MILERFKTALTDLKPVERPQGIGIGSFMHNCVLLDSDDKPLTPVFTWLDQRGEDGVTYVRSRLGDRFHERTGCRYHPMFPIFKLVALHLRDSALVAKTRRVVSAKAFLIHRLTGVWAEDYGMASSSGLYNLQMSDWDPSLLSLAGLTRDQMLPVTSRNQVVGHVTSQAAAEFGLMEGTAVMNGSGDGFLANVGSDCETPSRISVTLGTSGVARQALGNPVINHSSGTFCYKADETQFLVGCAGNNGGNVLDWGRSVFGDLNRETIEDIPIFIPLLYGERSPEWDPHVKGSFRELRNLHTAAHMGRSVMEGVIFNLQLFVEIIQDNSGIRPSEIVLSGNGFLDTIAAPILASVSDVPVLMPPNPGLASLRGAAICVLRALGQSVPPLDTATVSPLSEPQLAQRYKRYKELRHQI